VTVIFNVRDTSPWLQFPLLHKGVWKALLQEAMIGFHQSIFNKILAQFIP
jgi:hypothetical protein